jgi:hypothetical protein
MSIVGINYFKEKAISLWLPYLDKAALCMNNWHGAKRK